MPVGRAEVLIPTYLDRLERELQKGDTASHSSAPSLTWLHRGRTKPEGEGRRLILIQNPGFPRSVNILARIYLFLGFMWLVGTYVEVTSIWVSATREGLATGIYLTKVYTNGVGENYLELGLFFAFLPAVTWVFITLGRRLFVPESRSQADGADRTEVS